MAMGTWIVGARYNGKWVATKVIKRRDSNLTYMMNN